MQWLTCLRPDSCRFGCNRTRAGERRQSSRQPNAARVANDVRGRMARRQSSSAIRLSDLHCLYFDGTTDDGHVFVCDADDRPSNGLEAFGHLVHRTRGPSSPSVVFRQEFDTIPFDGRYRRCAGKGKQVFSPSISEKTPDFPICARDARSARTFLTLTPAEHSLLSERP